MFSRVTGGREEGHCKKERERETEEGELRGMKNRWMKKEGK